MPDIDAKKIEELRGLHEAAQLGMLRVGHDDGRIHVIRGDSGRIFSVCPKPRYDGGDKRSDAGATLVVKAINTLPALLDEIERLRELAKTHEMNHESCLTLLDQSRTKLARAVEALRSCRDMAQDVVASDSPIWEHYNPGGEDDHDDEPAKVYKIMLAADKAIREIDDG